MIQDFKILRENKNLLLSIYFSSILFFPTNYFYLYFVYLNLTTVIIISIGDSHKLNKTHLLYSILFFAYLLIGAIFRYYYYNFENIRDFIEITRFIPLVLIILFSEKFKGFPFKSFLKIIKFYILIDAIISILQFNRILPTVTHVFEKIYSHEIQIELSLLISNRSLGLSTNPGEHGLIILVLITIIILTYLDIKRESSNKNLLYIFLGIISIITSQSKTAFIGLMLLFILTSTYFIFKDKNKTHYKLYIISITIISIISYFAIKLLPKFKYLKSLFISGLESSSYQKREIKALDLLLKALNEKINILFGWGKEYFGYYSSAMDNEHLYIFLVYGPIVFIIFGLVLLKIILKNYNTNFLYNRIILFLIIIGIPVAWPNSYFLSPKISFILTFFYINYYIKNYENSSSRRL